MMETVLEGCYHSSASDKLLTLLECPNQLRQAILEIEEYFLKPYKPSEAEKLAARDDKFVEKNLFNLIDSSKKIVDLFKMLKPKRAFVLQSIIPAGKEKIR